MSDSSFLDTNVFLYSFDRTAREKRARARRLIEDALAGSTSVISYQVVQEFLNVALTRLTPPLTVPEAERYVDAVFRPLLSVHSSVALFAEALEIKNRFRLAWYDSLIVAAAVGAGCATLYTEDLQHGLRVNTLQVVNPFLASG